MKFRNIVIGRRLEDTSIIDPHNVYHFEYPQCCALSDLTTKVSSFDDLNKIDILKITCVCGINYLHPTYLDLGRKLFFTTRWDTPGILLIPRFRHGSLAVGDAVYIRRHRDSRICRVTGPGSLLPTVVRGRHAAASHPPHGRQLGEKCIRVWPHKSR